MELAERMRQSNYEQFHTLVRMHLSFELDVNTTDDNDVVLNEKLKSKKRFNFHKKAKICTSTTSPAFTNSHALCKEGIFQLRQLIKFLVLEQSKNAMESLCVISIEGADHFERYTRNFNTLMNNTKQFDSVRNVVRSLQMTLDITQEGIFRRTGSLARQNDLKSKINNCLPLNLDEGLYTVHDCASVFKGILSDLPEPLLTDTYNVAHNQIAELCNSLDKSQSNSKETRLVHSLQLLLLLLPKENYDLLKDIIEMLHQTTKYVSSNKMSASSLATLFTPHLICPKKLAPEALHQTSQQMSGIISFMITKGTDLFDIPPNLTIDIRAYFMKEQQKAMSPEHVLDESMHDSIANTVYTFLDKERTAQACVSGNPTDTALAQLYAHIQTLPESSKKRKLIKQFNKENGQGTPLQMLNRLKSTTSATKPTKSLGDSIKRHIFQKNLITKTGTKHQRPSPSAFDTPNRTPHTMLKSRQLFHSPYIPRQLQSGVKLISNKKSVSSPSLDENSLQTAKGNHTITTPIRKVLSDPSGSSIKEKQDDRSDNEVDSFEMLSETLNRLQDTSNCSNKKTVAFNVADVKVDSTNSSMNKSDFKSRYKSEPDLSRLFTEHTVNSTSISNNGRFITNKLLKGVSMVNLKHSLFTDRKVIRKSASVLLKQKSSVNELYQTPPRKENSLIDDEDFEATPNKENSLNWSQGSTDKFLGRRSMSPITKSTQRMSKAMQESIMTPRSRKPVMLIGASLGSSDQRNYQNSFSCLREEDEESSQLHSSESQEQRITLYRSKSDGNITELNADNVCHSNMTNQRNSSSAPESLTVPFRKYLLSRSVCTTCPVDSSFSSQPDDFGSTEDIQDLIESELSQSLLYCLNGNIPTDMSSISSVESNVNLPSRKRNIDNMIISDDGHSRKRMLVIKNVLLEPPGETSL